MEAEELGPLLRQLRASAGLTQEELAERAGISARTVSDVERGLRSAVYRDTAERLAVALGLEDEGRTRFESVARGPRRARLAEPPGAGPRAMAGAVPVQPTRLTGRGSELEAVRSALGSPDIRLLTITGPGGIGKTRLAVEAAVRTRDEFEDGTFFVPLAANRDAGLVAAIVAHAVGVTQTSDSPAEVLLDHLRDRHALLVLDTFEHVLDAAPLIGDLLATCPRVTALVTSQAPLRLRAERELALSPLDLPADARLPHVGELSGYSAIALFVERARAAKPDLVLDDETGPVVADICRRVDGLPLAIELAAARVKHLPLRALRDQLENRLRVLVGGPRDLPQRQQAMRDTVAWSYELLEAPERELFRRLSIFAGGWTLEAAETVCDAGGQGRDVLAGTSALVDKSLVFLSGASGAEPRYGMLDVIHEYAAERRDAGGDSDALGRRHADCFLRLAEEAEPELGGTEQGAWFRRLDDDHENLRAALRWSIAHGETDTALRLSGALWQFWRHRGDVTEGRSWLEAALGLDVAADAPARGKALWGAGWLAYHQGDFDRSESIGVELHESALRLGDRLGVRNGLTILGKVATARERYAEAIDPFREALAICREVGPQWLLATSLFNLGTAELLVGDAEQGQALFEEALALYRELGDAHFSARVLGYLAYPALQGGDVERARSLTATSLGLSVELADTWGIAEGLERISAVHAARGEPDRAARVAGAAKSVRETIAMEPMPEDEALIARSLAGARAELGEASWNAAWSRGRSMSFADAMEDALGAVGAKEIDEIEGP
ncbi:MAG: ATP-binding protein [Actinomycetota bacterium]